VMAEVNASDVPLEHSMPLTSTNKSKMEFWMSAVSNPNTTNEQAAPPPPSRHSPSPSRVVIRHNYSYYARGSTRHRYQGYCAPDGNNKRAQERERTTKAQHSRSGLQRTTETQEWRPIPTKS
jgi:hypothetical protein